MKNKPLSIGIIGTRGIPNRYGGFEACAEQLGLHLVNAGHQVSVYCPHDHPVKDIYWNGIRRIAIKNPENWLGSFGQFVYDLLCNLDSHGRKFDRVLHLGYTSDSVWYKQWAAGSTHIVNMDGMEWQRQKYAAPVRRFLKLAEKMAARHADLLVADNPAIADDLKQRYKTRIQYIPYGAVIPSSYDESVPGRYGLEKGNYDLMVARMEPENNILTAMLTQENGGDNPPLIIIGNHNKYRRKLEQRFSGNQDIRFIGPVYDQAILNSIRHFSRYYIHGHSAGGTNPSLLEAMACGCNILAHNNVFNQSVLGQRARFFSSASELSSLRAKQAQQEFVIWREANINMIRKHYNWESVSRAYEELFIDTK